jgi:hypothetical protein
MKMGDTVSIFSGSYYGLVDYIVRLGVSREQFGGLSERISANVSDAYVKEYREAIRKCGLMVARYLDTIADVSERDAISAAVEDMEGTEITVARTAAETEAMKKVSDYVRGLPLGPGQNNRLVALLEDMQKTISEEQFINGLTVGSRARARGAGENENAGKNQ